MAQILTKVRDPERLVMGLTAASDPPAILRDHIASTNEVVSPLLTTAVEHLASRNASLRNLLHDALLSKGDYDRAWFIRLGFEGGSNEWRRASRALAAAELSYASVVILDDIVDQGISRFGKPCLYRTAGTDAAIYVAEMLRALVIQQLLHSFCDLDVTSRTRHEILDRNERALCDINYGQYLDITTAGSTPASVTDEDYLELVHFTTGIDIANCIATGGLLADVDRRALSTLERIGSLIGTLMQVRDDLLDYAPSEGGIDKTPGRDFAKLRMKLPYLVAHRHANTADRSLLEMAAQRPDECSWEEVRQVVLSSSTVSYVRDVMRMLQSDLDAATRSAPIRSESRNMILLFSKEVLSVG